MPPSTYLLLHPEARLDAADRDVLRAWAGEGGGESSEEEDERREHEHKHEH